MNEYAVIIQKVKKGYIAYVPDLQGCVAVAKSADEVRALIQKTVDVHLRAMHEDRVPYPKATTEVFYILGAKRDPLKRVGDVSRILSSAVRAAAKTGFETAKSGIETAGKTTSRLTTRKSKGNGG
jgi:predicted RNase H-like HicB family nuclease